MTIIMTAIASPLSMERGLASAAGFHTRTHAVIDKIHAELPAGFSEKVADKILGGLLASAQALERMSPV